MTNKELINNSFEEHEDICVMASYCTIIEYFSNKEIKIEQLLRNYFEKYLFSITSEFDVKKKHDLIFKNFHRYCEEHNLRGFDYVKRLHENNELNTKKYCQIFESRASLEEIDDNCKESIRNYLTTHEALVMVLYKVTGGNHAVIIGYDSDNKNYFYKDSTNPKYQNDDILSQKEITEYIIFSK
jgi:hypothetical protein